MKLRLILLLVMALAIIWIPLAIFAGSQEVGTTTIEKVVTDDAQDFTQNDTTDGVNREILTQAAVFEMILIQDFAYDSGSQTGIVATDGTYEGMTAHTMAGYDAAFMKHASATEVWSTLIEYGATADMAIFLSTTPLEVTASLLLRKNQRTHRPPDPIMKATNATYRGTAITPRL